ncbi:mammalian cell entry protein [Mycobacterium antarcticum]|uniref:MCE family protein n=1 Tax=unclassified Mycolicibacterium TaxID=2636767 RepID=UPI002395D22B|nr:MULTISPECIES: MlaD family protein [unclassified Mycolicibacterium]BDX29604.1 mammalian cell entry protein [Mycolicibacterium sp. TUM20985]GLP73035.1 mammalian cell entry protein [Mycolicibacterium sp. TUM20983]GLP78750.1 mammalian cell entry protein [Mycolicibacterium sp. TUM20984]
MLTRFVKIQLVVFSILTVIALAVLGVYYLRLPSVVGIGQYELKAELPRSGGLYSTANVTYLGTQIGKVTDVRPTERGVLATMSIDSNYKIPADASANVHSVSAIGEQYLDLVSTSDKPGQYLAAGSTITNSTVPAEVGPALDAANNGLDALPREKIDSLLTETSEAIGGLGPALQRLVESTSAIASDLKDNLGPVNDIVNNLTPILDSQVQSGDAISQWTRNLNTITSQTAEQDQALRSGLQQAAPTADQLNAVFGDVREALPQTIANIAIVADLLKRYNKGLEQALVILPQGATVAQAGTIFPGEGLLHFGLSINQPPPCLTGFLPAAQWRSPADTSTQPLPDGLYCKIPKDFQGNVVRGARNYPCADVPGKRAATPEECRSNTPYEPLGTNPWYGDPNQILTCPAAGARCDQPVKPGYVVPAPTINNGLNPLPADQLPPRPSPLSDPLTAPGQGTVACSGQQPNPCIYTPAAGPAAVYTPSNGQVVGPDGVQYSVTNSSDPGENGWKEMLAPAG